MGLKRKLRKGFRKTCLCMCCGANNKNHEDTPKTETESENVQSLLLKALQNQIEEQKRQAQLMQMIIYLLRVLQQFSNSQSYFQKNHSGQTFSQCILQVSYQNLFQPQRNERSKSLMVIHPDKNLSMNKSSSFCLNKTNYGTYPTIKQSLTIDKAIQISSENRSRFIQTNESNNSDLTIFKMHLIKIMKNLKENIVAITQLLLKEENTNLQNYSLSQDAHMFQGNVRGRQYDPQFLRARIRALNFAKFYNLGKSEKKQKEIAKSEILT